MQGIDVHIVGSHGESATDGGAFHAGAKGGGESGGSRGQIEAGINEAQAIGCVGAVGEELAVHAVDRPAGQHAVGHGDGGTVVHEVGQHAGGRAGIATGQSDALITAQHAVLAVVGVLNQQVGAGQAVDAGNVEFDRTATGFQL